MQDHLKTMQKAVKKAIFLAHQRGMPVYQAKEGYIIAIYPDGREVRLEKISQKIH